MGTAVLINIVVPNAALTQGGTYLSNDMNNNYYHDKGNMPLEGVMTFFLHHLLLGVPFLCP